MTEKLKLSPWHDGNVKPAHVGIYQVKCILKRCGTCKKDEYFSFFDGANFNGMYTTINGAHLHRNDGAFDKIGKWRGILK